jgi:hypothetical protein
VQGEDAFNDDDGFDRYGEATVGDAGVSGEVVHGCGDVAPGGEGANVLGEEGVFERIGVVEVLAVALFEREVAQVAVVEVERQERGGELFGELARERGLTGAGTAGDGEDEGLGEPAGNTVSSVIARRVFVAGDLFVLNFRQDGFEESGEAGFGEAAYLHDFEVVQGFGGNSGGEVRYQRDAQDIEAHVACDEHLVDGGHADEVGTEGAEGADLGWRLERWAEDG